MKGTLADQVCAYGVAPVQQLAIGAWSAAVSAGDALEEMDFQRLVSGPGGRKDAATLGQVVELGIGHHLDELFAVHKILRDWLLDI
jgi:hypothetical protein